MNKERYNQIIGEVYENYESQQTNMFIPIWSQDEFINKIKTDSKFSETWGLKIEERELSLEERYDLIEKDKHIQFVKCESLGTDRIKEVLDKEHVPTKLITLICNNETIESYE